MDKSCGFPFNLFFQNGSKSPAITQSLTKLTENRASGNDICENALSSKGCSGDADEGAKCSSNYKKKVQKEGEAGRNLDSNNVFKKSNGKVSDGVEDVSCSKNLSNGDLPKGDSLDSKDDSGEVYYYPDKIIEIMDKDTPKWSSKAKNKKKHSRNKSSGPEGDLIKTLVRKAHSYEEETSSTTTETSNPDSDYSTEKVPILFRVSEDYLSSKCVNMG